MDALFLKIFNLSVIAGWITLAILILRPLLKKAPKAITVLLWALVAIRLIFPFSIESVISLIPSAETVPPEIIYAEAPAIESGIHYVNSTINPVVSESLAPTPEASVNPLQIIVSVASVIWVVGMIAMALYAAVSYLRIRLKVRASLAVEKNIRICDNIDSPFILGILRPRIYLPSELDESQREYVIAHEEAHLKRKDHWWKPLGFALLTVYWFHPLLWVAYILLCRDIELACDERVIKNMESSEKASYSEALLACSMPRRMISACPLAFGEVGVKKRIKAILHYKKPAFWFAIIALIVCIVCTGCLLTDPIKEKEEKGTEKGTEEEKSPVTLYQNYSFGEVVFLNDNSYTDRFGIYLPLDYHLENNRLYRTQYNQTTFLGTIAPIDLTKENFDDLFGDEGVWYTNDTAQALRENNEAAWEVVNSEKNESTPDYYLLKQKGSDNLLLMCLSDESTKEIRYVYQLVPTNEEQLLSNEQIIQRFLNGNPDQIYSLDCSTQGEEAYGITLYSEQWGGFAKRYKGSQTNVVLGFFFDYTWNQEKIVASVDGQPVFTLTPSQNGFIYEKMPGAENVITESKNLLPDGTFFALISYTVK